jgi:hypothetical protein
MISTKLRQRLKDAWDVFFHCARVARRRKELPAILPDEIAEAKAFFPMEKFFILGHSR